uniref:Uncharacterized protein n=1 Tax=Phlebia radiata TaxID=5308 RepID=L8B9F6_PHLRA|nr:hypothetical protein PRA_mt0168 [Phlebia radiata]CCE89235.1 hypothetical protein PRA_mt0168 [Phlebia radiata]
MMELARVIICRTSRLSQETLVLPRWFDMNPASLSFLYILSIGALSVMKPEFLCRVPFLCREYVVALEWEMFVPRKRAFSL